MSQLKIGVSLDSMDLPLRQALSEAARLGVGGVQADARGDLLPDRLTETGRREFRNLLRGHNLQLTAMGCPLRHGLDVPDGLDARLEHVRRVMALAFDLGARLVIVQAGRIPDDLDSPEGSLLRQSLGDLARHGDRVGTVLALESGLDSGEKTKAFLDRFDTGSLGVNYDPANMLLNGHDPVANLFPLRGWIVHSHAHDARRAGASRPAQEVPVGAGDIEWMGYLAALESVEYRGWLVVERETGTQRLADIRASVEFLRRFVG
ncbi:MAG TPA: sugar phosphate isomerase/epimerase family protein [Gemmataceae bacterium]